MWNSISNIMDTLASKQNADYNSVLCSVFIGMCSAWVLKGKVFKTASLRNFTQAIHFNTKLVLIVRTDLGMGKGKLASQCAHAAVSCYEEALETSPNILKLWKLMGQPKIVLKAEEDGEEFLYQLSDKAKALGLTTALIRDAGKTQIERGSVTVLGIGPGPISIIDQVTKNLKLL